MKPIHTIGSMLSIVLPMIAGCLHAEAGKVASDRTHRAAAATSQPVPDPPPSDAVAYLEAIGKLRNAETLYQEVLKGYKEAGSPEHLFPVVQSFHERRRRLQREVSETENKLVAAHVTDDSLVNRAADSAEVTWVPMVLRDDRDGRSGSAQALHVALVGLDIARRTCDLTITVDQDSTVVQGLREREQVSVRGYEIRVGELRYEPRVVALLIRRSAEPSGKPAKQIAQAGSESRTAEKGDNQPDRPRQKSDWTFFTSSGGPENTARTTPGPLLPRPASLSTKTVAQTMPTYSYSTPGATTTSRITNVWTYSGYGQSTLPQTTYGSPGGSLTSVNSVAVSPDVRWCKPFASGHDVTTFYRSGATSIQVYEPTQYVASPVPAGGYQPIMVNPRPAMWFYSGGCRPAMQSPSGRRVMIHR